LASRHPRGRPAAGLVRRQPPRRDDGGAARAVCRAAGARGRRHLGLDLRPRGAAPGAGYRRAPAAAELPLPSATGMRTLAELLRAPQAPGQRLTVAGAPEGHDAFVLGRLVADGIVEGLLQVCRDDGRMARFAAALAFFHPEIEVLTFPAWDCLPY